MSKRPGPDLVAAAEDATIALLKAQVTAGKALSALLKPREQTPGEPFIDIIARMPGQRERDVATRLLRLVAPIGQALQDQHDSDT